MRATLSQIEAFYWIARLGGFHAAAARLNLAQPTISLRVRGLEKALGVKLFERAGRLAKLTTEGRHLLPHAERMVGLSEELHLKAALEDPLRGRLRLGAPDSFGLTSMPALLASLRKQYPDLSVALTIDNSSVLSQMLNDRELDVAIVADPEVAAHVGKEPIGTIECVWVASAKLGLPDRPVRPRDLLHHEIFTNPDPSNLITLLRDWFATAGLEATRLSTCNSLSVILRLTMAGEGVSLLPKPILPRRTRGSLQILKAHPQIGRPRLFGAYQLDRAGRMVDTVIATARALSAR
ncbi:LysR family transcriptional regulator [Hypericibacter adhaerens]|uniref:LysR family transcriptional regulator n=1 Tax=Hypericibacter adhaerens TaxID=2602016 RepID=A0A5J6NAF0_9PROT|nr:LysR family transcriptional regulator [Hypericibacter adhaerens]QEX24746.1 LysR family transcriptional regulator [Hypericibacter adhaerens]